MEKEHEIFGDCLYYSSSALSRVLTQMAREEFSTTGLTPSYAFLLMSVNKNPGITPTSLAFTMQLKPSTITRLIEKLEYRGLLERNVRGKNTEVFATEKAKKMNKKVQKAWKALASRYNAILGEDFAKKLTQEIYKTSSKIETV